MRSAWPAIFVLVLDRSGDEVVARLPGGGDRLVKGGYPGSVLFVRHVFHLLADAAVVELIAHPFMAVADEPPDGFGRTGFDANDHQPGKQPVRHRQGDHARVELTERNPPFLRQRPQPIVLVVEHL